MRSNHTRVLFIDIMDSQAQIIRIERSTVKITCNYLPFKQLLANMRARARNDLIIQIIRSIRSARYKMESKLPATMAGAMESFRSLSRDKVHWPVQ